MGRNKGICTLCGKGGKLTFEHVPAEASGNQRGVIMYSLDEWLGRDQATWQMSGGRVQPEGMGLTALCLECNRDVLGARYVPAFVDFVEAGRQCLREVAPRLAEFDDRERETLIDIKLTSVRKPMVAKQIVSMLLLTSGREVVEKNQALAEYVLKPEANGLPDNYRLFLALTAGPAAKTTGLSTRVRGDGDVAVFAEIVYPPFAYALSFNGAEVYPSGEITSWTRTPADQIDSEVELRMPLGFCYTAFPGDLRTSAQIRREQQRNS